MGLKLVRIGDRKGRPYHDTASQSKAYHGRGGACPRPGCPVMLTAPDKEYNPL